MWCHFYIILIMTIMNYWQVIKCCQSTLSTTKNGKIYKRGWWKENTKQKYWKRTDIIYDSAWFCCLCVLLPWCLKIPKDANNSWHASHRMQRLIDRSERVFVEISCSCNFCGSYCCLTMHINFFSPLLCFKIEGLYFNFSLL